MSNIGLRLQIESMNERLLLLLLLFYLFFVMRNSSIVVNFMAAKIPSGNILLCFYGPLIRCLGLTKFVVY